ncbi:MAG: GAF domain-containing protein, partial [Planctomycetes bacterium]|nr:GAF domain-containing protein [Planctomycetota bacterium]
MNNLAQVSGDHGTQPALVAFIPEESIMAPVKKLLYNSLGIGAVSGLVIFLLAFLFISDIRNKFNKFLKVFRDMSRGDISNKLTLGGHDEFAVAADSFNRLVDYLQEVVSVCEGVMVGDYNRTIEKKGENDLLGNAVEKMTSTLREVMEIQQREDWLKTGYAELNDRMRGEQDLPTLTRNILTFVAEYLQAHVGALYLADQDERFKLAGSYAFTKRKELSNEFEIGEGLVGQAALEKKPILIENAPEDYIAIRSGLGKAKPFNILVVPFLYEEECKGVLELGSFSPFTDQQVGYLDNAAVNIGIAFNTAQSRFQMEELLNQTQIQAERLKNQQEELRASNEELESQTMLLKESETKLQAQQEELRQTNEELEERSQALLEQSAQLERKNDELEKARKIIEQKAADLELTSKYKSEFLANMSHELRTPLNSMLILSKLFMENRENRLTEKEVEFATTIHNAGNELLNLINEILDLSKVESGKMELNIEQIHLADISEYAEKHFSPLTNQKGLELEVACEEGLPEYICSDSQRVDQIIKNFMSNAIKFTEKGRITLSIGRPEPDVRFSRESLDPARTVALAVTDTGKGIAKNKQKLIFEAFQQEDGTTSRKYGGTGLGLSISREIAKMLGGEIQLRSEEGRGSTFTLYLPEVFQVDEKTPQNMDRADRDENPQERREAPAQKAPQRSEMAKPRREAKKPVTKHESVEAPDDRNNLKPDDRSLLVIEDDPTFAKILYNLAHARSFKCLLADSGETGLQMAYQYQPSAIILDIGLPGMDGWAVIERLKNTLETRHIPVHILSASDSAQNALQKGAIGYLIKPASEEN